MSQMSILEKIKDAGVVGCGGAGFPTHAKFSGEVEYLIINAAECEPLLKTDHFVMRNHAVETIKAIEMVKSQVGAEFAVIATKRYYTEEIAALRSAITELDASVTIHEMDNVYPTGDEQVMVFEVTGRVVPPSGIPLMVGCIVSNVSTMWNVFHAIQDDAPVVRKQLTVTGAVGEPKLLDVPVGTPFEVCLAAAGGTTLNEYLFLDGGPMMGKLNDQSTIADKVVTKTTSGLIVAEDTGYLHKLHYQTVEQIFNETKSACIQCSLCSDLCPRKQLGHDIQPHKVMRHFAVAEDITDIKPDPIWEEAMICCECGICEVIACPMGLSPRQVNIHVKKELLKQGVRYQTDKKEFTPDPMREYKSIAPKNILIKMGLQQYADVQLETMHYLDVDEVFIPTKMHIGAPSIPVVSEGDIVKKGDLIAKIPDTALGANIHASIDGQIIRITEEQVHIKKVMS
ncbi:propanediol utilization protein [Listeria monocytogenes]|nr:propanediol utilization protein [Listeria monocytogenes]